MSNDVCYAWSLFHKNGGSEKKMTGIICPWNEYIQITFLLSCTPYPFCCLFITQYIPVNGNITVFNINPFFFISEPLFAICSVEIQWIQFIRKDYLSKKILQLSGYCDYRIIGTSWRQLLTRSCTIHIMILFVE